MYFVTLRLSAQSSTVVSSISSTVDGLRIRGRYRAWPPTPVLSLRRNASGISRVVGQGSRLSHGSRRPTVAQSAHSPLTESASDTATPVRLLGHGRADLRRHRCARRARHAALRLPVERARSRARRGPAGRASGEELRRGEDGAPRPPRARVVARRRRRAGAAHAHRLGDDPVRLRRPTTRSPSANDLRRSLRPRHRRIARHRKGDRAPLRLARRSAGRDRLHAGDRAAEETAAELRALGAEPILVRGNVASQRVADEVAALGALDVLVHARRRA